MSHPTADGQDGCRKRRFPWIRCREQAGTSPQAHSVLRTVCRVELTREVADSGPSLLMGCTYGTVPPMAAWDPSPKLQGLVPNINMI